MSGSGDFFLMPGRMGADNFSDLHSAANPSNHRGTRVMLHLLRLHNVLLLFGLSLMMVVFASASIDKRTHPLPPASIPPDYGYLIDQLVLDGFDRAYLRSLFTDPRVQFLPDVLRVNLINAYTQSDYTHFTSRQSARRAGHFLAQETAFLGRVEQRFGVDKEVIVAILFIESSLGKSTGKNTVFNVFSTLSLASRPEIHKAIAEEIVAAHPNITMADIEKRGRRKSKWAYQELKTLLTLTRQESIDVFKIKGSWAGAFGMAQFLPSSYLKFALDGNNDRKVRLHNRYDAMVSVANFLKEYGWNMDLPEAEKKLIIRKYNNSSAYAEAVLHLSRIIVR